MPRPASRVVGEYNASMYAKKKEAQLYQSNYSRNINAASTSSQARHARNSILFKRYQLALGRGW